MKNFINIIGYAKKLTFLKLKNLMLLFFSFYFSKLLKKNYMWGLPSAISIEPTTSCNLECPQCPSGLRFFTRKTGNIDLSFYEKLIEKTAKYITQILFYFQGEPFIHTKFIELVKKANKLGIYTATSTNGHFFNNKTVTQIIESGLNKIIISIDGTTQNTYEEYRKKGDLKKVIWGTKKLVEHKKKSNSKTPFIVFQFLVVKNNEHQIKDIKKLAKNLNVDKLQLKTAQIYDFKNGNSLIPKNTKYSRYKKLKNGEYAIKNKLYNHCWKMWHSCVITWNGLVVPCCFDKDATHIMGNLNNNNFKDIWKSKAYSKFRKQILSSRKNIDICKNCTEGTKIWV